MLCDHVASEDTVELASHENRTWRAKVAIRDPSCDLALLKIEGVDAEPVRFADPAGISEAQTVFALGHPLGFEFTVSRGIVSNRGRMIQGVTYVQTDVPLNPGNSGGPIVNEKGDVVGVADWIAEEGRGLGFAVALRHVFAFAARCRIKLRRVNDFPWDAV